jgi:hypothetical protein
MSTPVRPANDAANTTVFDDDESIPVLTERLTLPALDIDFALPALEQPAPFAAPAPMATTFMPPAEPPVPPPPQPPPPPTVGEVRDAVLKAVLQQLPAEIETLMQQQLRPIVEAAVAHLSATASQSLHETLVNVVERAVRDALNKDGAESA